MQYSFTKANLHKYLYSRHPSISHSLNIAS